MGALLRFGRVAIAVLLLAAVARAGLSPRETVVSERGAVATLRIPEGGGMPRAVVDGEGTLHVAYVHGGASRADLFHVTRESGAAGWSEPQRVNSRALSVTGLGPVDGAQLAVGPDDRLHVVWLQSEPPAFFYTRSRADGPGFEPQRELPAGEAGSLEAGPSVAAAGAGDVYVFWHAGAFEDARRSVFLTASRDGGTTFEPARRVSPEAEGACACCGLAAASDAAGAIHVSYREPATTCAGAAAADVDRPRSHLLRPAGPSVGAGGVPGVDHEPVRGPASNIVFNVQIKDPGAEVPPPTGTRPFDFVEWGDTVYPGWEAIDLAALAVAESAPLFLVPGRRCENGRPVPVDRADWQEYTAAVVEAGRAAYRASQSRDWDAVIAVTDQLNEACANCHVVYRDVGAEGRGVGADRCRKDP